VRELDETNVQPGWDVVYTTLPSCREERSNTKKKSSVGREYIGVEISWSSEGIKLLLLFYCSLQKKKKNSANSVRLAPIY
jgi:hypothetical protein